VSVYNKATLKCTSYRYTIDIPIPIGIAIFFILLWVYLHDIEPGKLGMAFSKTNAQVCFGKIPTVKPSCPGHRPQSVNTDCLLRLRVVPSKIEVTISGQGGT